MVQSVDNRFEDNRKFIVSIKNMYLTELPFQLETRRGLAVVFSFFGDKEEVSEFFQKASHKTRAYFINARGLRGFLEVYSFIGDLLKSMVDEKLLKVIKYQNINMKDLVKVLKKKATLNEMIDYLGLMSPDLTRFVLKARGLETELEQYKK